MIYNSIKWCKNISCILFAHLKFSKKSRLKSDELRLGEDGVIFILFSKYSSNSTIRKDLLYLN
jgi:hypothetical protein